MAEALLSRETEFALVAQTVTDNTNMIAAQLLGFSRVLREDRVGY